MMGYPKREKDIRCACDGFNDAISQMSAEIRRRCEASKIMHIIRTSDWFVKSKVPTHNDIFKTSEAIRKHFEEDLGD